MIVRAELKSALQTGGAAVESLIQTLGRIRNASIVRAKKRYMYVWFLRSIEALDHDMGVPVVHTIRSAALDSQELRALISAKQQSAMGRDEVQTIVNQPALVASGVRGHKPLEAIRQEIMANKQ